MASPADDSVWGSVLGFPGALMRMDPGRESAGDGAGGNLQGAMERTEGVGSGLLAARHGRRQGRRRVDGARQRSARELRSPQVQGAAERPDGGGRQAVSGRLDALHGAGTELQGRHRRRRGRLELLQLVRQVQFARARRERADCHGQRLGGALLALVNGKWVVLRVPYPLGFYAKSINGRIDDPKAGWKGRGLWTGWSNRNPWHNEGGKGKSSMAVHFQVRPDPLAK